MSRAMFTTLEELTLASSSPRRQRFLRDLGISFKVMTTEIDETPLSDESPHMFAMRMANTKAMEIATKNPTNWVIGADTVVTLGDRTILGKPTDTNDALAILKQLNNTTHSVMTGVSLCCLEENVDTTLVETTEVTFMDNPDELLAAYIRTGEPMDKAGAYGIQGLGSCLISSINGSCTNVIGLPINRMIPMLMEHNIIKPIPLSS